MLVKKNTREWSEPSPSKMQMRSKGQENMIEREKATQKLNLQPMSTSFPQFDLFFSLLM